MKDVPSEMNHTAVANVAQATDLLSELLRDAVDVQGCLLKASDLLGIDTGDQIRRFSIGVPDDLYRWLQVTADESGCSLNSTVNAVLRGAMDQAQRKVEDSD